MCGGSSSETVWFKSALHSCQVPHLEQPINISYGFMYESDSLHQSLIQYTDFRFGSQILLAKENEVLNHSAAERNTCRRKGQREKGAGWKDVLSHTGTRMLQSCHRLSTCGSEQCKYQQSKPAHTPFTPRVIHSFIYRCVHRGTNYSLQSYQIFQTSSLCSFCHSLEISVSVCWPGEQVLCLLAPFCCFNPHLW